jgi:hypothetical protein
MLRSPLARVLFTIFIAFGVASQAPAGTLSELPTVKSYKSSRVSSYDRSGGNADGGQGNPLKPGQTRTIANIAGSGQIAHIWLTMGGGGGLDTLRDVIVRMYWDGERTPSVECPIGEFFGLGHGRRYTYASLPFAIGNDEALNCFLPMPFKRSAKVTIENVGVGNLEAFYYYIDYQTFDAPRNDLLYFHGQYRQEKPVLSKGNYTILDATGRGHYVGCFLYAKQNQDGWFGEGDDMIYIDGAKTPALFGTGTEDYFCHAWGFAKNTSTDRFGAPWNSGDAKGSEYSVYRFHLEDAIAFKKSISMTIEHGHGNNRSDDFSSVAYWYQTEPHTAFPPLAAPFYRRSTQERMDSLLKERRLPDLLRLQEDIAARTQSPEARRTAAMNVIQSLAGEIGGKDGVNAILDVLGPFPSPDLVQEASKRIGELGGDPSLIPPAQVRAVRGVPDGRINNVKIDGRRCLKTDSRAGSKYIYFDVDDNVLHDADKPTMLEVDYYNSGKRGDTFRIEYDSAVSDKDTDKYRPTAAFIKPGRKGWNKAIFYLDRARFAGRQNGEADFRVYCGVDADECIGGIRVIVKQD